jgi:hypothetical protein
VIIATTSRLHRHLVFRPPLRYILSFKFVHGTNVVSFLFPFCSQFFSHHVSILPAQIHDSTFIEAEFVAITAASKATVTVSNCNFTNGREALEVSNSTVYIVDSEFIGHNAFETTVITIRSGSELTLERCTIKQNVAFWNGWYAVIQPAMNHAQSSKLILKGNENKFIKNYSAVGNTIGLGGAHIQVGSGSEISGCKSTTFLLSQEKQGYCE